VVCNGTTPSLYVNGAFQKTGLTSAFSVHPSVLIGCGGDYGYFHGCADDMRVYDRVLTEAEIAGLYHENGWAE
jgi:hypothetical protein